MIEFSKTVFLAWIPILTLCGVAQAANLDFTCQGDVKIDLTGGEAGTMTLKGCGDPTGEVTAQLAAAPDRIIPIVLSPGQPRPLVGYIGLEGSTPQNSSFRLKGTIANLASGSQLFDAEMAQNTADEGEPAIYTDVYRLTGTLACTTQVVDHCP